MVINPVRIVVTQMKKWKCKRVEILNQNFEKITSQENQNETEMCLELN